MTGERMYPLLPCRDIDEAIAFYATLGFTKTYRQVKPNPHAVVAREDMALHLFGMDGFDPAQSYGSVIIVVPDPDALYRSFAEGLRAAYKKLPVAGIPRIVRPRKRFGTVYGFSVVDVGGNWLRISKLGDREDAEESLDQGKTAKSLTHFVELAARLGDAHGDDDKALKALEGGLQRFPSAAPLELARAHLYRADLAVRLQKLDVARASLAVIGALELSKRDRAAIAEELAHAQTLVDDAQA